jgi:hypothetical protein
VIFYPESNDSDETHTPIAKCRLLSLDLLRKRKLFGKELNSTSWRTFKQTYGSVPEQHLKNRTAVYRNNIDEKDFQEG